MQLQFKGGATIGATGTNTASYVSFILERFKK